MGSLENSIIGGTKISSFEIPENVSKVHGYMSNTNILTTLTIHPKNKYLRIENNMIYSSNFSILFYVFNRTLSDYTIHNTVTIIGDYCFHGSEATTFNLPNSVTILGQCSFYNSKVTSINVPNSLTTIGDNCFYQTKISVFSFPNSLITIGDYGFENTYLKTLIIPSSVKSIGHKAFYRCYSLINVTF